jgi:hypothetical protein
MPCLRPSTALAVLGPRLDAIYCGAESARGTRKSASAGWVRVALWSRLDGRFVVRGEHEETKAAFKTTEFIAYVIILVGMFIAAAVTDNGDDGQGFGADQVWLYATILTVGYMIARGLAKSGSREYYDSDEDHDRR